MNTSETLEELYKKLSHIERFIIRDRKNNSSIHLKEKKLLFVNFCCENVIKKVITALEGLGFTDSTVYFIPNNKDDVERFVETGEVDFVIVLERDCSLGRSETIYKDIGSKIKNMIATIADSIKIDKPHVHILDKNSVAEDLKQLIIKSFKLNEYMSSTM